VAVAPTPKLPVISSFESLGLVETLVRSVHAEGYTDPTPIQLAAVPHVLAGRDLLGCAQTGTGKTAAFALPILQRLAAAPPRRDRSRPLRALVLSPTRELAAQIGESFSRYGRHTGLTQTVIFGGVGQDAQARTLHRGVDILVATPGRLLDLMSQGLVGLASIEVFVLDEADRMLDMGFLPDVRRVVAALPRKRQTLFFSATMPEAIQSLADGMLIDPVRVAVTPIASTAERIEQSVYMVERGNKRALLEHLLQSANIERALVFTRTKHGANRVAEQLMRASIQAEAIHGNKSQNARTRALDHFKTGTTRVLVATDIAARGIDIDGISHVINYELPNIPESYVHRIGRTARAGASGIALSFCDSEERAFLRDIEKLIRAQVPRVVDHPFRSATPDAEPARGRAPSAAPRRPGGPGQPPAHRGRRPGGGGGGGGGRGPGGGGSRSPGGGGGGGGGGGRFHGGSR
jgi:ATP-dependent RNA helicase RhlE